MILLKQQLSKKDKFKISVLISEIKDIYSEFYITKNNLRLFIKDNIDSLWENLRKGDKIIFDSNGKSLAVINGYAEKTIKIVDRVTLKETIINSRKMVKLLADNADIASKILEFINWNFPNIVLFAKIKKNNPISKSFFSNSFIFLGGRGNEILLKRDRIKEKLVSYEEEKIDGEIIKTNYIVSGYSK